MGRTTADIRKKLGMTQKEFAVRFYIPLRTVQNWEQRECCPEYVHFMLFEIAELLKMHADQRTYIAQLECIILSQSDDSELRYDEDEIANIFS